MNKQIKEIRSLQIVALSLLRTLPGCKVKQVWSQYFDLLVTFEGSALVIGVEVKNSGFLKTSHFQDYINILSTINVSDRENKIPVLLAAVNEEDESVKIGFLLAWRFGKARIYRKPAMMDLNSKNADKILDFAKSMDETARFLSVHGMKVVKKIAVEVENADGRLSHGTLIYLRDFTEEYKMHPKEVVDERERIERLIKGTPQNEYPEDILDRTIFEMIRHQYPEAIKVSDLLLFSSELRDLQLLSHSQIRSVDFEILPDLNILPLETVPIVMNALRSIRFSVDVFIDFPPDVAVFDNLRLSITKPLGEWNELVQEFSNALMTMSSPRDLFIEGEL